MIGCFSATGFSTDSTLKTLTTDGSVTDVQNAVNAATDGWTVLIPAGSFTWTNGITISGKGIHLQGAGAGSSTISGSASPKLSITKDASHSVEVSGLTFTGGTLQIMGYGAWAAKPFLIHDCTFNENNSGSIRLQVNGALIYNCQFNGVGNYGDQAIKVKMDSDTESQWASPDTLGTNDTNGNRNVYVENCTFTNMIYQALDFDGCSRIVVRSNLFHDSALSSHGADTSPIGMRQYEVYNNRFIFRNMGDCDGSQTKNLDYLMYIRGGTGCIFSNITDNLSSCAWGNKTEIKLTVYNITRNGGQVPCQTNYPAFQQLGQGHNGTNYFTDPLYLWSNSASADIAIYQYTPDECGNGQVIGNYLQVNRDYVLSARPGYASYTYPHPLRGPAARSAGPVAPPHLWITNPN